MATAKLIITSARESSFWRDRWIMLFTGLAVLINLIAVGYVVYRYAYLPEYLPLHYNALGDVDYIGTRIEAFKIPLIGTAVWLVNIVMGLFLHQFESLASRILLAAAVVAQVLILVAVIIVVS